VPSRLAVRDITKHYGGVQALRGVTLHVDAGEVLGLVGDNGAGKSTLAKILSGATFPSAGQVLHRAADGGAGGNPAIRGLRLWR
jgi:simple sugar transport system ATP-binding protein